ncbi:MAG: DUF2029 domain-containing protein [Acidobacteriia bacterium]|nr:DUF2029 domain-containing protein [Terriglobia bacterium]
MRRARSITPGNEETRQKTLETWLILAVSFGALFLVAFGSPDVRQHETDFLSFYSGARLVGTPHLYSLQHAREIQTQVSHPEGVLAYVRLPFYAAVLWPLGQLPYVTALSLWLTLNIAGLAGFIWLWTPRLTSVLLCCWFFPVWLNFGSGQDVPLMLCAVALGSWLLSRDKPYLAGLAFALCSAKFHLFFLLPVFLLARRLWRCTAGFGTGGALLLVLSFLAGGRNWPLDFYSTIHTTGILDVSAKMPNLYGLLHGLPLAGGWIAILSLLVVGATWYAVRRMPLRDALAVAVAGGLLVSLHAYLYDCALLLPLLLVLEDRLGWSKLVKIFIAISLASLTLPLPSVSWIGQVCVIALFTSAIYMAWRSGAGSLARPSPGSSGRTRSVPSGK